MERRIGELVEGIARAFGARAAVDYRRDYPVTVNDADAAAFCADVAEQVAGLGQVERNAPPVLGAEDFSFMLEARPGAFIFLGQGDTVGVHHPEYDFNDEIIPVGCSYWARLAETAMPI